MKHDATDNQHRSPLTSPPSRPAERYGDIRPAWHSTLARVLTATLAVIGIGWVVLAGWNSANRDVRYSDVGFEIIDDAHARVTYDVTVYRGRTATCTLHAMAEDFSVVGRATVQVDVGERTSVREQSDVLTQQRAVTVIVAGCTVP